MKFFNVLATVRDATVLTLSCLLLCVGCGGGTSGTGQSSILIDGTVRNAEGSALANLSVMVSSAAGTEAFVTDSEGRFAALVDAEPGEELIFEFSSAAAGVMASASLVSPSAQVSVEFSIKEAGPLDEVEVKAVRDEIPAQPQAETEERRRKTEVTAAPIGPTPTPVAEPEIPTPQTPAPQLTPPPPAGSPTAQSGPPPNVSLDDGPQATPPAATPTPAVSSTVSNSLDDGSSGNTPSTPTPATGGNIAATLE